MMPSLERFHENSTAIEQQLDSARRVVELPPSNPVASSEITYCDFKGFQVMKFATLRAHAVGSKDPPVWDTLGDGKGLPARVRISPDPTTTKVIPPPIMCAGLPWDPPQGWEGGDKCVSTGACQFENQEARTSGLEPKWIQQIHPSVCTEQAHGTWPAHRASVPDTVPRQTERTCLTATVSWHQSTHPQSNRRAAGSRNHVCGLTMGSRTARMSMHSVLCRRKAVH